MRVGRIRRREVRIRRREGRIRRKEGGIIRREGRIRKNINLQMKREWLVKPTDEKING